LPRVSSPLKGAKRIPNPMPIPNPAKKDFIRMLLWFWRQKILCQPML
jgi:hypothetical protein